MYENYAGIIPSFNLFCKLMDECTQNYGALYIHNQGQSNDWRDSVYWYKAKVEHMPKKWKFGSRDYWDFHNQRFNNEYKEF